MIEPEEIRRRFEDPDYAFVEKCFYPWKSARVNPYGNVYSCSIDVIASLLAFEHYEEAETVMRVRQRGGKNASMFLSMPMLRAKVDELKRAQVEAELRCF